MSQRDYQHKPHKKRRESD